MAIKISGTTVIDDGSQLNVTGVSTLGLVKISSGIVTATTTTGVVTYFGDGSQLSGVVSGIALSEAGASRGTSITRINFASGATVTTASSGVSTISISAGSTVANNSNNVTYYPIFTETTTGTISTSFVNTTKLTFNPSTGTLTVGNSLSVTGVGTFNTNGTGARTIQSGGTASGGNNGDIYYIY